jgi:putative phage-type endonuclease
MKKLGLGEKFTGNTATKHGEKYEDEAIDLFCKKMGFNSLNFGLLQHPTVPYLAGSPDGITYCGKVLEVKCPLYRKVEKGKVPPHYLAQIYINMEIAGLDEGYFIEYVPRTVTKGEPILNIVKIDKDPKWFKKAKPILDKFYEEYCLYSKIGAENHPEYEKYLIKDPVCQVFPELHEDRFPVDESLKDDSKHKSIILGSQDTPDDDTDGEDEYSYGSFVVEDSDIDKNNIEPIPFDKGFIEFVKDEANKYMKGESTLGEFLGTDNKEPDFSTTMDLLMEIDSASDSDDSDYNPCSKKIKRS